MEINKIKYQQNDPAKIHDFHPEVQDEINDAIAELSQIKKALDAHFGGNASKADTAIDTFSDVLKGVASNAKKDANTDPFAFDPSLNFTYSNAIFALGAAINELMATQPGIIAADQAIQNNLVSQISTNFSNAWLAQLKTDEAAIQAAGTDAGKIAAAQGQMSVDNAASSASSQLMNSAMSLVTQGVSSKTTTYQNLAQQAQSVVTALLNAMVQNWVL